MATFTIITLALISHYLYNLYPIGLVKWFDTASSNK